MSGKGPHKGSQTLRLTFRAFLLTGSLRSVLNTSQFWAGRCTHTVLAFPTVYGLRYAWEILNTQLVKNPGPLLLKGLKAAFFTKSSLSTMKVLDQIMLRILQARFQQYMNCELQVFKLDSEKAEEPEIKLPISVGSLKKQESSRKTSTSGLLTMPKPLTVWITRNCGKFFKRWEYQTTWPDSWEICMQVRKQRLELDMEQQTGSK